MEPRKKIPSYAGGAKQGTLVIERAYISDLGTMYFSATNAQIWP